MTEMIMADTKRETANGHAAEPQDTAAETPVTAEGQGEAQPQQPTNPNMRWYIIHTYSGFEKKVKESLESRVEAFGLKEKIGRVVIPTETVTTVRGGKKICPSAFAIIPSPQ